MSVRLTRERSGVRASLLPFFGALAQLGARHIRIVEATGSNPVYSIEKWFDYFLMFCDPID